MLALTKRLDSGSDLEGLEELVRNGLYRNRSEVIRAAVRDLLRRELGDGMFKVVEALERDPEAVRQALREPLKNDYAADLILKFAGAGRPRPAAGQAGGGGWEA